jgi:hypothetical protein
MAPRWAGTKALLWAASRVESTVEKSACPSVVARADWWAVLMADSMVDRWAARRAAATAADWAVLKAEWTAERRAGLTADSRVWRRAVGSVGTKVAAMVVCLAGR